MSDSVVRDVSDAELLSTLEDLEFEGFEVVERVKGSNGLWTLTVRRKSGPGANHPTPSTNVASGTQAALIPNQWMPNCVMQRIICHWTAGAYKASEHDRAAYHILIEKDGTLVRGNHSIADNVSTADNVYARHTKGCNSGSIGITVCCMADAHEAPFRPGPSPMTREQWDLLARVAAQLAGRYGIAVTPKTILGHGEVQEQLGKPQEGKWDPMVFPWDPAVPKQEVGRRFRARVSELLANA